MSTTEQEDLKLPAQVSGPLAAAVAVAIVLMMTGAYLMKPGAPAADPKAAAPVGTYQTACWTLAHPVKLKKSGADMDVVTQAFVACVVTDSRTGEVLKEFIPSIPGAR